MTTLVIEVSSCLRFVLDSVNVECILQDNRSEIEMDFVYLLLCLSIAYCKYVDILFNGMHAQLERKYPGDVSQ